MNSNMHDHDQTNKIYEILFRESWRIGLLVIYYAGVCTLFHTNVLR